jgi:hypothetical protein
MSLDAMLKMIFPNQQKYRDITRSILELFSEKGELSGNELVLDQTVRHLESKGYNRNTVYKLMREYLVPYGIINWKKFEGSIQLSNKFAHSLRRFSISWKNYTDSLGKRTSQSVSSVQ